MTTTAPPPSRGPTNLPATTPEPDSGQNSAGHHQRAAQQAVEANSTRLDFHLGATEVHLTLPPLDRMAFYVGLAGAAAFGVVDWPIAVLTGVGHLLSDDRRNRTLRALGEALDAV